MGALLLQDAALSGPLLLAALLATFLGGVLVTYACLRFNAQALYKLLQSRAAENESEPKEPEG